jgi:thiol:disulfide interchange protein DsbA
MNNTLFKWFFIAFLTVFASLPQAAEETGYELLPSPQPTQNPDKVEVIEFFWYGCPHCYVFEPLLENWAKNLPANVEFIHKPAFFNDLYAKHAKVYFTAEALGVVDKVHRDLFDAIHDGLKNGNKNIMTADEELGKFFAAHGVAEADFLNAYNSFLVDTKMRQGQEAGPRYGINGVPALIVNGKYLVNSTTAGSHEAMLDVANRLIEQESGQKK